MYEQYNASGNQQGYCYYLTLTGEHDCFNKATIDDFIDGYELIDGSCQIVVNPTTAPTTTPSSNPTTTPTTDPTDYGIFPTPEELNLTHENYWALIGALAIVCGVMFWGKVFR
ncbi:MAG: hypothetical protein U9N49_11010 [Campylobacterota bacterium]|nr:hypothetical protein [Campylobacterota bacterium]